MLRSVQKRDACEELLGYCERELQMLLNNLRPILIKYRNIKFDIISSLMDTNNDTFH